MYITSCAKVGGGSLGVYLVQRTTSLMLRYLSICRACKTRQVLVQRRTVQLRCCILFSKFIALWQCIIRKYWYFVKCYVSVNSRPIGYILTINFVVLLKMIEQWTTGNGIYF